jgi:hypothetical protein
VITNADGSKAVPLGLAAVEAIQNAAGMRIDLMALLTVAGPVLIALITGWFANKQASKKVGTDAVGIANQGFQILITELQKENVKLVERQERLLGKLDEATRKIGDMEDEVRAMGRHIDRLERALTAAGVDVPAKPN